MTLLWERSQDRARRDLEARVKVDQAVIRAATYDALVDIYSILPLGTNKRGQLVPLIRKSGETPKPGLTGGALERAVDRWAAKPRYAGRIH